MGIERRITKEVFIERAKKVHPNNYYDYSLVEMNGMQTPVKIKCNRCGKINMQQPNQHLKGCGCYDCKVKENHKKQCLTTEEYIKRAELAHPGKFSYEETVYKRSSEKVKIFCKSCNDYFFVHAGHLINKNSQTDKYTGCDRCFNKSLVLPINKFLEKANKVHNNKYDYDKVIQNGYKNTRDIIEIKCPIHGYFKQDVSNHLGGKGCSKCKSSKGELAISRWLMDHNISFKSQYIFSDCGNGLYRYDFYIPELNLVIEFDGEYHYSFGGFNVDSEKARANLLNTKFRDSIKTEYCNQKGIYILRIPFYDIKDVNTILYNVVELEVFNVKPNSYELVYEGNLIPEDFTEIIKVSSYDDVVYKSMIIYGNDKYEIEKFDFINEDQVINIKCNACGVVFVKTIKKFLSGWGCDDCLTQKRSVIGISYNVRFIEKSKTNFPNKFDYSKTDCSSSREKITLICNECKTVFEIMPHKHIHSKHGGCPTCARKIINESKRKTTEDFIKDSKALYGNKFDYADTVYIGSDKHLTIKCNDCGFVHKVTPEGHVRNVSMGGCSSCNSIKREKERKALYAVKFVEDAHKIEGNKEKFDYSKVVYIRAIDKVIIGCKVCGQDFEQSPNNHLRGNGCPHCYKKSMSK